VSQAERVKYNDDDDIDDDDDINVVDDSNDKNAEVP